MSRRRLLRGSLAVAGLGLLAGCGITPLTWQWGAKVPRIGILAVTSEQVMVSAVASFREGMLAQGYVEGREYVLESRHAAGRNERLPDLAAELVRLPVDVVVASGLAAIIAARNATATIPIVMPSVGSDPVDLGLVASLAQPGGNVTGMMNLDSRLQGKRMDLLRELLPTLSRVAWFRDLSNPGTPSSDAEAQPTIEAMAIRVQSLPLRSATDIEPAFEAASREHADALVVVGTPFMQLNQTHIVEGAARHRLPAIYVSREWAQTGGLMAYGANREAAWRRAASYVDRILKGAKPADLPIEQPTTVDFVVNLKTAQELGIAVPQSVLQQATEVIQ